MNQYFLSVFRKESTMFSLKKRDKKRNQKSSSILKKKDLCLWLGLGFVLTSFLIGTDLSAGELLLRGGKLVPLDSSQIEMSPDHMNFCFATRYSDGAIHLNHSKGIHTVTEYGCSDLSKDNGKSWKCVIKEGACGINSFENLKKEKIQLGCWNLQKKKKHTVSISVYDEAKGKRVLRKKSEIELPYISQFLMHRDVIRLKSGHLLATAYGHKENAKKCHNFVLESTDDGENWRYLADIADDPQGKTAEGPDETTIFELHDGTVVAAYREDGNGPMKQKKSKDGGKTWSMPVEIAPFGASPHGRVLADGTVVIVSGRPDVYLLVDFTGKAENYQKVPLYIGSGSSYASVLETASNEILVIYDESDFGISRSPTPFSFLHASRYKMVKDSSLDKSYGDPRAKDYSVFYSPVVNKLPQDYRLAIPAAYQKKAPDALTWYEIVAIPERPQPVLRIVSHGDNEKVPGSQWSLFRSVGRLENIQKLKIGFEFRLGDADVKTPQFMVSGTVGASNKEKGVFGYVCFGTNEIIYYDKSVRKSMKYNIGTSKFHAFTMNLDNGSHQWTLTVQGAPKPLITAELSKNNGVGAISWGDGSAMIYGSADLSYIGWTY